MGVSRYGPANCAEPFTTAFAGRPIGDPTGERGAWANIYCAQLAPSASTKTIELNRLTCRGIPGVANTVRVHFIPASLRMNSQNMQRIVFGCVRAWRSLRFQIRAVCSGLLILRKVREAFQFGMRLGGWPQSY